MLTGSYNKIWNAQKIMSYEFIVTEQRLCSTITIIKFTENCWMTIFDIFNQPLTCCWMFNNPSWQKTTPRIVFFVKPVFFLHKVFRIQVFAAIKILCSLNRQQKPFKSIGVWTLNSKLKFLFSTTKQIQDPAEHDDTLSHQEKVLREF